MYVSNTYYYYYHYCYYVYIYIYTYSGKRACYICLQSGWGSDGNLYTIVCCAARETFGEQAGHNAQPLHWSDSSTHASRKRS